MIDEDSQKRIESVEVSKLPINVSWKFHFYSEEAWKAMYDACESAIKRIDFEQFIFLNDSIGLQFSELLIKKSKEGVKVRLLVDAGGSYGFFNSSLSKRLTENGVEIEFFNKISPLRLHNLRIWFFRNHRKILIVDGNKAFMGGVGIGDFLSGWRDTHVEIVGDVVSQIEESFETMWRMSIKEKFIPFPQPKFLPSGFSLITNAPHNRQRFIYRRFVSAIKNAKKYVYITTPYFIPDTRLFRAMRGAAKRGVDVRLLLPVQSDHRYVDWASRFHFHKSLKSGIRIWEYNVMLHSKSMVIDGEWATLGSTNMDNYSLFFNYEANIVSIDKKFAEEISSHFEKDMMQSKEVLESEWQNRGFIVKVLEFLSVSMARFL